jgi:SAM-dependent methyltransferase
MTRSAEERATRHAGEPSRAAGCAVSFPDEPAGAPCPACGGGEGRVFYAVPSVPAHSSVLLPSQEEAARHPRRELRLCHCPGCAFIWNERFDATADAADLPQESTQGFSPTFSAFARELAANLAARHHLEGQRVLEIGCGDGEFLALLCDATGCQGVGYDPLATPGRVDHPNVTILKQRFDARCAPLEARLVVCRHTLEHIPDVLSFLRMIRTCIPPGAGTSLFFEVPDVTRQLREAAFWDFYHEHCSYFSPGSISRVFARAGFEVERVERAYGEQYLLLAANSMASGRAAECDDRATIASLIASFRSNAANTIRGWRSFIDERAGGGRRIVLWGSGSKAAGFLATLGLGDEVAAVVDVNPRKDGRFMPGLTQEIIAPARLAALKPDAVIVMNPVYVDEIRTQLRSINLEPEVTAL